jgi:hypothetical protein
MSKRKIKMRLRGSQQQRQERLNRVLGQVNVAGPATATGRSSEPAKMGRAER